MRGPLGVVLVFAALVTAACTASDEREWLKVNQRYTKQEFQRDHRECSRDSKLFESCMRQRGWVPVSPSKSETESAPAAPARVPRY